MKLLCAIHGILTSQTARDWPDILDAWCADHAPGVQVLKKEYHAGPFPLLNRYIVNPPLAAGLVDEIEVFAERHRDLEVHMVAHSNGTDIALQAIKLLADRDIDVQTFIAVGSVLKSNVERSGIADLMRGEHLGRAVAYVSRNDHAIKWGRWSAYGDLGRKGWVAGKETVQRVLDESGRVAYRNPSLLGDGELITRRFDAFGHGDYFTAAHREHTFNLFLRDCGISRDGGEVSEGREAESVSARRETSLPSQPSRETQ